MSEREPWECPLCGTSMNESRAHSDKECLLYYMELNLAEAKREIARLKSTPVEGEVVVGRAHRNLLGGIVTVARPGQPNEDVYLSQLVLSHFKGDDRDLQVIIRAVREERER